jgi:hypothetical protein
MRFTDKAMKAPMAPAIINIKSVRIIFTVFLRLKIRLLLVSFGTVAAGFGWQTWPHFPFFGI